MSGEAVAEGHYYRKQLGCKSRIIAWSHGARFKMALKLIGSAPDRKVLDYGCGDGTFLAMAAPDVLEGWGADLDAVQIEDCRARLAGIPKLHFCTVGDLVGPEHDSAYELVTCMETLEHCLEPVVEVVLGDLARLCAPQGTVIISVPIEVGPTFLLKYSIRKVAGWRGLGDYRHYENYGAGDAWKMLAASDKTQVLRPIYGEPGSTFHTHYGFNWRRLRRRVEAHFRIERTLFSPLGPLGRWFGSQAWFVCRPKVAG